MLHFSHVSMPLELMAVDTSHTMTSSNIIKVEFIKTNPQYHTIEIFIRYYINIFIYTHIRVVYTFQGTRMNHTNACVHTYVFL